MVPADSESVFLTAGQGDLIAAAFPTGLYSDALAVGHAMPDTPHGPIGSFCVLLDGESVTIPERIYNAEPPPTCTFSDVQRTLFHCVYTRHHDGFVRQKNLVGLLGRYAMRLLGEYVLPIVQDIQRTLAANSGGREALSRFAQENPGFVELTRQRATSYWNEYYRHDFPKAADYPGLAALALVHSSPRRDTARGD